ncbi:hypothetical protein JCM10213v2_001313 [Rhodosporidiobolus nylandii]
MVLTRSHSRASAQPGGEAVTSTSVFAPPRQPQAQHDTMTAALPALPEHAPAPLSPLFGAGEEDFAVGGCGAGVDAMDGMDGLDGTEWMLAAGALGGGANGPIDTSLADYALLNDILTSQGLSAVSPPPPAASAPYGGSTFTHPQQRALSFDAQLGSPLFDCDDDGGEDDTFSLAGSPALDYDNTGGAWDASPAWHDASAQASPVWSDVAVSPQMLATAGDFGVGAGGETGQSPLMERLDLFSSFGYDVGGTGAGAEFQQHAHHPQQPQYEANGAHSTSASRFPPLPELVYSPVIAPTASPALNDGDVSPIALSAALPLPLLPPLPAPLPAPVAAPSADPPSASTSSATSPSTPPLDADSGGDSDGEYVPPRSLSPGPASRPRRSTTTTSRKSSTSAASPPPGLKVALDAPVTSRTYKITSRTSAKPITQAMRRKMAAAAARGEVITEAEAVDEVARKRAANTLSARQSRAKKAQHLAELERVKEEYERERERWNGEKRRLEEEVERLRGEVKRVRRG